MKRARTELDSNDEPIVEQTVSPSTASVILDSQQAPRYGLGKSAEFFTAYGGLVSKNPDSFVPGPLKNNQIIPNPGGTIFSLGNDVPSLESSSVNDVGLFGANINPMSGCERTKYYGSYHDVMEWDTHRGNTLLSIRLFLEPVNDGVANPNYYVEDFFIRIPDGLVFLGDHAKTITDLARLLDFLLFSRTYSSDWGPYNFGWLQPGIESFTPAVSVVTNPGAAPNVFLPIIRCVETPDGKLCLKMDTSNATIFTPSYLGSNSTFVIFDHPNSITNRGGLWSGFGHSNPLLNAKETAEQSGFVDKGASTRFENTDKLPRYTTYPLGGTLILRERIPKIQFTNSETSRMDKVNYEKWKKITFDKFVPNEITLGSGGIVPDPTQPFSLFGAVNSYPSVRTPMFKDSRYFIHTSDEIAFDRKGPSYFSKTLQSASVAGNLAFGIDFREFETDESAVNGSVGRWRESVYDGSEFNPAIHLSKNTSLMKIEISSYDEYGDRLTSDPSGNAPQARNLPAGESFVPVPDLNDHIDYVDFIYSNTQPTGNMGSQHSVGVNHPVLSLYGPKKFISFPTTFTLLQGNISKQPIDLDEYYDNGARIGSGASVVHFFLNEIY
jgi:hypothetical protein